jgi:predicted transposase YdaD
LQGPQTGAEFRRRLDFVEFTLVNKFPLLTIEEIKQMLNLKEASVRETRFFQEVLQEGLQTGRQEGRQEGEADFALRLLALRCGEISMEQQAQVRRLPIGPLAALGEALLDFGGMADFEQWLREHVGA